MSVGAIVLLSAYVWIADYDDTPVDEVGPADAVVVFVGGRGERVETAEALMAAGVADTLVLPNGAEIRSRRTRQLCAATDLPYEVVCDAPDTADTGGEARLFRRLAAERGWDRLVMVTTSYHVSRARLRLGRCFDGEIVVVAASTRANPAALVRNLAHEYLGHIEARTIERSC
ncbi:MAG: YdcF family protein [Actinomycetota bacterium]